MGEWTALRRLSTNHHSPFNQSCAPQRESPRSAPFRLAAIRVSEFLSFGFRFGLGVWAWRPTLPPPEEPELKNSEKALAATPFNHSPFTFLTSQPRGLPSSCLPAFQISESRLGGVARRPRRWRSGKNRRFAAPAGSACPFIGLNRVSSHRHPLLDFAFGFRISDFSFPFPAFRLSQFFKHPSPGFRHSVGVRHRGGRGNLRRAIPRSGLRRPSSTAPRPAGPSPAPATTRADESNAA